ncbi:iron-siderophore ABC transporter substrate-binding protein [Leucobacter sp. USHLN153]|uniref:iron-siderophore ABC transporter substrate-binding protein n=1 Tax=Leucobacter sp. USHLN153 TaxID=3081268 RepID=UPI003019D5B2
MRPYLKHSRPAARRAALGGVAVFALLLTGCAGSSNAAEGSGATEDSADAGAFPVTIEHALGETTIEAQPERPAAVGWGSADVSIALGFVPVGMPEQAYGDTDGDNLLEWVRDAIDEAGAEVPPLYSEVDGVPFEAIADTEPDVVLAANSGLSDQDFSTLSEIAPTVAYPDQPYGTGWRETTELVGKALGKETEAKDLVAEAEQTISDALAEHPDLEGKTAMVAWVDAQDLGKIQVYTPADTRVQFLEDLGFTIAPGVVELSENQDGFVFSISAEEADKLDADLAIMFVQGGDLSTMEKDPLLSKIPAVANGTVALINDEDLLMALSSPSVLSIPWAIDELTDRLDEAAANVR